jgi:hypothetical protein
VTEEQGFENKMVTKISGIILEGVRKSTITALIIIGNPPV